MKFPLFLFSYIGILSMQYFAQTKEISIEWTKGQSKDFNGQNLTVPGFFNQHIDNAKPLYFFKEKVNNANLLVELKEIRSVEASQSDKAYFMSLGITLPSRLEIDYGVKKEKHQPYFVVSCFPFYLEGKTMKKVTNLQFGFTAQATSAYAKDFASESVLRQGSGQWYKIRIDRDGIYKLDYSFLEGLGINMASIHPNAIHVYGNGDGVLPELNSIPRKDDLVNNAIYIEGDGDGEFNANDYILFYGVGPHKWIPNGSVEFDRSQHIYSDYAYYFININSSTLPKRVLNSPDTTGTVDFEVNAYDYRDVYEQDLVNLVSGGQRWYGEQFDVDLEQSFNFVVPKILNTPVQFKTAIATNSYTSAGTSQRYSINGNVLLDDLLPAVGVDYIRSPKSFTWNSPQDNFSLSIKINRNSPSTVTYLDRILINARRELDFLGTQFGFRNLTESSPGSLARYSITNFPSNGFVWDVSDVNNPKRIIGMLTNSTYQFTTNHIYKEYVASNGTSFFTPEFVSTIEPQNLHGLEIPNHLIITDELLLEQANRLADLHRNEGKIVHVVTDERVFNEFSSGAPDATAFRMICKMFYDRDQIQGTNKFETLLLFGDGTFDTKNRVANNNNLLLTYQVLNSENHISALVTDDYFGMLDDNEAIGSSDLLDIGIGRIIASDVIQAKQQVDKIEHYMQNGSNLFSAQNASCCLGNQSDKTFGDWRLKYVQIADDEENGYFINQDTEPQYEIVKENNFSMNCDKLYLDAFPQDVTAGGQRYPDVFDAITNRVQRGALIVNYVGHGGEVGLAEERVVTIPQINSWTNIDNMHLFVSATCEFTKYDDPSRVSAGEWLALNPSGGAIALMTTTRSVFFGVNSTTGRQFYNNVFSRDINGNPSTFGEIVRLTKNQSGTSNNKRSFTLIGDPALRIALPRWRVITDSINGLHPSLQEDTLSALSKVTIKGHIEDFQGNPLNNFQGILTPSVFDKPKTLQTLGQDPQSPQITYELQRNIVYRGKSTISNGQFEFSFVVPKDIELNIGRGKISYYADNEIMDAQGFDTSFRIGGIDPNGLVDEIGPEINLYMNDQNFISGSITDQNPVLIVTLKDENGINTVGTGIGHDITAILDNESSNPIVLNEYYSSDIDSYNSGEIRYPFLNLTPGVHHLKIKAWDVNNNSSTAEIEFEVFSAEDVEITRLYNYPNPFTTNTEFMFEHNQSCSQLDVTVQIMTISGKLVKTIKQIAPTEGFRVNSIYWDGRDDFGSNIGKGVYLYRCLIRTPDGRLAEKIEKLAILK